ncbi:YolD-like family protein [Planococcus sp. YIM B11945]|uniref:YolD-like family protein n=1 Tax=Planococcus sp. YIM B11945 TaxID=3435410 RepID=UPI003D7DD4B6
MGKINKQMKQVGDIKDRGNIKWQGLFLSEHVQMLRDLRKEKSKMPKPNLDEYDMQLISEEMDLALKRQCDVVIHTWKDGEVTRHHGTIANIDIQRREFFMEDPFKSHRLNLDEVVSVNMVD